MDHSDSEGEVECISGPSGTSQKCNPAESLSRQRDHGEEKSSSDADDEDDRAACVMDVDEDDEAWVCHRCTLQNVVRSSRCELCEAPRRSISFSSCSVDSVTGQRQQSADADGRVDTHGTGDNKLQVHDSVLHVDESDNATTQHVSDGDKQQASDGDKQQADWAVWRCTSCTYNNNPSWADVCDVCEVVKQTQKQAPVEKSAVNRTVSQLKEDVAVTWLCAKCAAVNSDSVPDCMHCSAVCVIADSESTQDTWTCTKCTLLNNIVAHVCAACLSKRNTILPQIDDSDTKWPCQKCTCINHSSQDLCQACGHHRLTSHSYNSNHQVPDKSESKFMRQRSVSVKEQQIREEVAARDQWIQIVNFCKVNGEQFVDDSFPPIGRSLHYDGSSGKVAQWLRLNHVKLHNREEERLPWTVFSSPKPSDICQGVLGNCWFLSSLSVVAERPELLESIVVTREFCTQGVYQLRLCKDGHWTTVIVDDVFPCDEFCRLLYSQAKRKQLWVPLIEKALAKVYGCYEALTAGRCIEGLSTLTGAPCCSISMSESQKTEDCKNLVWAQLLSSRESGFLMGASCGSGNMKVDDKAYEQVGLVARHAYSILDVQIVEGYRLLRLRNPWGRFSWTGNWSNGSELWKRLKRAECNRLKPLSQQEGTFWISLDDVMKYFDSVDICKYRSDWMESRQKITLPSTVAKKPLVTQIEVFEAMEVDIGLFQEGARSQETSKRNSVDLCVCVYQCRGTEAVGGPVGPLISSSKREVRYFAGANCFLEPGVYLLFAMAFNHWSLDVASVDAVLTVHSCKAHLVSTLTVSTTCLADAIIQLAIAKGERHEGREGMTVYYLTRNWAGFIAVVENRHPDCALHVQCDCSDSTNVVSTRGALKTVDAIPALHRQVIILLTHVERSSGYSVSHRLVHRLWSIGTGLGDWAPGANHMPALTLEVYGLHAPRPL